MKAWRVVDFEEGARADGLDDLKLGDDDDEDDDDDEESGTEGEIDGDGQEVGRTSKSSRGKGSMFGGIVGGFGAERKDGSTGFGLLDRTPEISPPTTSTRGRFDSSLHDATHNDIDPHQLTKQRANQQPPEWDPEVIDEDDDGESRPRPFTIRLIDFAHTRLVQGEGKDEGVLRGLWNVVRLLEGRLRELEEGVTKSV